MLKKNLLRNIFVVTIALFVMPIFVNAEDKLQDLIDAAENNSVIKLDKNYNEQITIDSGKKITIDLNGHDINVTEASKDAISNRGDLTLKGNGEVKAVGAAIVNYPGAKCLIDNGSYFSTGWYTIKNMGTMIINNMHFANDVNNGASLIDNGYYGSPSYDRGETAKDSVSLTINGGSFENKNNSCNVIKNDDYGNLVINGGTFTARSSSPTNANPVVQNWHKATINGGTFKSINGVAVVNGHCHDVSDVGILTINGGTFIAETSLFGDNGGSSQGKGTLTINNGVFHGNVTLSTKYETIIKGGVFDQDLGNNIPSGYKSYQVIGSDQTVVIKPSDLKYKTTVSKINEEDIKEDAKLMKAILKEGQKIVAYYDIDLYNEAFDTYKVEQITDASNKVKVTLTLPKEALETKDGYIRTYYIVRVHNGKSEIINVTNNNDWTISFETDKFSSYGLTYSDTKNEISNPKTFDNTILFGILFTVSLLGVILGTKYVEKHSK